MCFRNVINVKDERYIYGIHLIKVTKIDNLASTGMSRSIPWRRAEDRLSSVKNIADHGDNGNVHTNK